MFTTSLVSIYDHAVKDLTDEQFAQFQDMFIDTLFDQRDPDRVRLLLAGEVPEADSLKAIVSAITATEAVDKTVLLSIISHLSPQVTSTTVHLATPPVRLQVSGVKTTAHTTHQQQQPQLATAHSQPPQPTVLSAKKAKIVKKSLRIISKLGGAYKKYGCSKASCPKCSIFLYTVPLTLCSRNHPTTDPCNGTGWYPHLNQQQWKQYHSSSTPRRKWKGIFKLGIHCLQNPLFAFQQELSGCATRNSGPVPTNDGLADAHRCTDSEQMADATKHSADATAPLDAAQPMDETPQNDLQSAEFQPDVTPSPTLPEGAAQAVKAGTKRQRTSTSSASSIASQTDRVLDKYKEGYVKNLLYLKQLYRQSRGKHPNFGRALYDYMQHIAVGIYPTFTHKDCVDLGLPAME